jgi:hypothetical protein
MAHLTTPRAALAAAGVAAIAEVLPPGPGLYATVAAAAGLLAAAFVAYLAVIDRPGVVTVAESAVYATAGLLVLAAAAVRFPEVLAGGDPPAAGLLSRAALGLVLAATLAPPAAGLSRTALARIAGSRSDPPDDGVPARPARRWRRALGAQ